MRELGTLEELFEIWSARVLGLHDKPVVILDSYGVYEPLNDLMPGLINQGFAQAKIFDCRRPCRQNRLLGRVAAVALFSEPGSGAAEFAL